MADLIGVAPRRLRTPPKRVFFLVLCQRCRWAVVEVGDDVGGDVGVALVDGRGTSLVGLVILNFGMGKSGLSRVLEMKKIRIKCVSIKKIKK